MEGSKWQGSLEIPLTAPLERAWQIASDFYAMKTWFPSLNACERVEGTPEHGPGCVRCVSSFLSSPDQLSWAKEKLVSFDSANHSYSYVVIESNMEGFHGYQATFQILEGEKEGTCLVKWNFEIEPVAGHSEKEFVGNWSSVLAGIVKTLGEAAASSS